MIDFKEITRIIREQFEEIIYNGDCSYREYFISVAEEQDFNRIEDKSPNHIYIVVKYLKASINYSQTLLPVLIDAISENGKLDVCKKLLSEYAEMNNLKMTNDDTVRQFYTLPQVSSNFEEIYDGYRSILEMSGTFLINKNGNSYRYYLNVFNVEYLGNSITNVRISERKFLESIKKNRLELIGVHQFDYRLRDGQEGWSTYNPYDFGITYDGEVQDGDSIRVTIEREEIVNLNNNSGFEVQHDSQVFFNSSNNIRSMGKSKVKVISISTYLLNTEFINRATAISLDDYDKAPLGENTEFCITKEYKVGNLKGTRIFKLSNYTDSASIAEFPLVNISLTI